MNTYTTLNQRAAKAAHVLVAALWHEWPGDDPAELQPVVTDWLKETARNIQTAGTRGHQLIRAVNDEADDYYQAMIDTPDKTAQDALTGRLHMAMALLITLGCSAPEIHTLSTWHTALSGAVNNAMYHIN